MLYKVRAWPLQGMAEEKVLLSIRESIARDIWKRPEHREKVIHSMICISRGGLERTVGEDQGRRGEGSRERGQRERRNQERGGEGGRGVIRARAHGQDDRIIWEEEAGGRKAHELEEFRAAGGVEKR